MSHKHQDAILAYPYVPAQKFTMRYSDDDAIIRGTLFPELDLPFGCFENSKHLPSTPMTELMKLDFVCLELKLYLDVNPNDTNTLALYRDYQRRSEEAKNKTLGSQAQFNYNNWVYDPWSWELED
ncbi:MAG: spore coat associated protein CotJA [Defluviitaleaceae bacterium]|nr:spore coat associated protein CotJA [Defluviitaleaceae bacterium]